SVLPRWQIRPPRNDSPPLGNGGMGNVPKSQVGPNSVMVVKLAASTSVNTTPKPRVVPGVFVPGTKNARMVSLAFSVVNTQGAFAGTGESYSPRPLKNPPPPDRRGGPNPVGGPPPGRPPSTRGAAPQG